MTLIDPKILKESLIIVLLSIGIALTINLFHPKGYILIEKNRIKSKIIYISGEEAKIKYDKGAALFVDSRSAYEFMRGHIKGALSVPAYPESASFNKIKKYFNRLQEPIELVIYCTGRSCGTSKDLADRLFGLGYKRHIYIIKEGYPKWVELGYPVKESERR